MKLLIALLFIILSLTCVAENLVVDYTSFYSHTKKLQGEDTDTLQFAFGFQHIHTKALCHIQSAYITTQKLDIPLSILPNQRFLIPTEKALKMAKAKVVIDLVESANLCDMSVQLETKPEFLKTIYTEQELKLLLKQYKSFFEGMGGFLSFLMPEVAGINLHFTDDARLLSLPEGLNLENTSLALETEWIEGGKGLQLNVAPLRITAIVVK